MSWALVGQISVLALVLTFCGAFIYAARITINNKKEGK